MRPIARRRQPRLRLRFRPLSRRERIASAVLATGMTVLAVVLIIGLPVRFMLVLPPELTGKAESTGERLVYVDPRVQMPRVALQRRAMPAPTPVEARRDTATADEPILPSDMQNAPSTPRVEVLLPVPAPYSVSGPEVESRPQSPVGASASGLTAGFPGRRAGPIRYDSALGVARDRLAARLASGNGHVKLTQAERDAQMRAQALDAAAARGAGVPATFGAATGASGGGIAVPLPFGGPSRKQRERDRREYAEALKILARVNERADSIIAARRRRFADSVAMFMDSSRSLRP